ncbi:BgTH12-01923 [Blumeria graminis f. sp. triticale]|uniref:BgTH12-01923 n=1 Tax=Blumeria graminis f. sp. triticale TaxID=1689686 RepID=A0A9W4D001_BLUGR|nr:BgTH12-01923 [Blumeria graminis f. sp. triticale]
MDVSNFDIFASSESEQHHSHLGIHDIDEWEEEMETRKLAVPHEPSRKMKAAAHSPDSNMKAAEEKALLELGAVNWVGRLQEYRAANVRAAQRLDLEFIEELSHSMHFPRFSCTVLIPEHPRPFGSNLNTLSFASKKPAKQYAAKKAIDWLIDNNYMPDSGAVRFSKSQKQSLTSMSQDAASTCASRVPRLCQRLGFSPPRYVIEPVTPGSSFYDAYVDFGNDHRVKGVIGEINNIYGKKNAKEELAKIVVEFLRVFEKERFERMDRRAGQKQLMLRQSGLP